MFSKGDEKWTMRGWPLLICMVLAWVPNKAPAILNIVPTVLMVVSVFDGRTLEPLTFPACDPTRLKPSAAALKVFEEAFKAVPSKLMVPFTFPPATTSTMAIKSFGLNVALLVVAQETSPS